MSDDDNVGKIYDQLLMRRLLAYLAPYRMSVAVALLLVLIVSGLKLVGPYLTKIAIDDYIANGNLDGMTRLGLLYAAVLILEFGTAFAQVYIMNLTGQRVMYDMRREIFTHLQRLDPAFFDRNPVGRLVTRVTTDVDALNELFTSGVVTIFGDVFMLLGIMIVMISMDWRLALVTFTVLPALFAVTLVFKRRVRVVYRRVRSRIARMNAFIQENVVGMQVVQLFHQEPRQYRSFNRINREHTEANLDSIYQYAIFYPVVELLGAVAIALILWYGGGQILLGALSLGALVAFVQYSEKFFRPISDLTEKFNILQSAMASSERIFALLDTEVLVASPPEAVVEQPVDAGRDRTGASSNTMIAFDGVWFAYQAEDWILRDINLTIREGERLAIVGPTGSGKTTLTSLLLRLYDVQRGSLRVDGRDVRHWDPQDLRRQFGVVQQDVHLFSGTLASNIKLGAPIADARLQEAVHAVHLDELIAEMPRGLDETVNERGASLSAGQRQLVSFARALARDPRILILDEATSSVDTQTELLIREALDRLLANRTSIVIAHRLSTIQNADRIVVIHKGIVRESGTHQELLAARGIYFRLYRLQYQDQEIGVTSKGP